MSEERPKFRRYERRPFLKPIRYQLTNPHMEKLEKIDCDGVSVDISKGGLGIITDYPLREGDILFFEEEIKPNDFKVNSAAVRWATEIEKNRYRVGMEFVR